MNSADDSFWQLDDRALRRLSQLILYEHTMSDLKMAKLVEHMPYLKDWKTFDNHAHGRTPWTPHAVKAAVAFLLEDDRKTTPAQFLEALRSDSFDDDHAWALEGGCRPLHPRYRDAVKMLNRLAEAEQRASSSLTFGIYPPMWLMPKQMMEHHVDWLLRLHRGKRKEKHRDGLGRLERGRYDLFCQQAEKNVLNRIVVMRTANFMALVERRPPLYNHFTLEDINEFLTLLESVATPQRRLLFEVAVFDDWDAGTEIRFCAVGESTFIGDDFWFGHVVFRPFYWWCERDGTGRWPRSLDRTRETIEELLLGWCKDPARFEDMRLFFGQVREQINSPVPLPVIEQPTLTPAQKQAKANILEFIRTELKD